LVGVGGGVVSFVNDEALWSKTVEPQGAFSPQGLDGANHDLWPIFLVLRFDTDPKLRVLEGDTICGLLEELASVGKDESLVAFLFAKLADQGAEESGLSGAGRHDNQDPLQPLVFACQNLSESFCLIGAQKDLGDTHRDS
jgi:hypothetical protein